ncbi:MAG: hypothetical protein GY719_37800 [bacterium]|nr:hypothetical protein [bacterium]
MNRPAEPPEPEPLTLLEVALLVEGHEIPPASRRRLRRFHRADPRLKEPLGELESLAVDAGVDDLVDGLFYNREVDRLLDAGDWAHPAEVLDPHGDVGISYPELLAVADARARRTGDDQRVAEVREKLARTVAERATKDDLVRKILEPVLGLDREEVKRLFSQALVELWSVRHGGEGS